MAHRFTLHRETRHIGLVVDPDLGFLVRLHRRADPGPDPRLQLHLQLRAVHHVGRTLLLHARGDSQHPPRHGHRNGRGFQQDLRLDGAHHRNVRRVHKHSNLCLGESVHRGWTVEFLFPLRDEWEGEFVGPFAYNKNKNKKVNVYQRHHGTSDVCA